MLGFGIGVRQGGLHKATSDIADGAGFLGFFVLNGEVFTRNLSDARGMLLAAGRNRRNGFQAEERRLFWRAHRHSLPPILIWDRILLRGLKTMGLRFTSPPQREV